MRSDNPIYENPLPAALDPTSSLLPAGTPTEDDEQRTIRRLQLFMGTRLGVATLLLGGTLLIALENDHGFESFTPRFLVGLIATIYGASLVTAMWLLGTRHRQRVAIAQIATDLVVTTGLVYVTGGPGSGFTFLFGVAVLMAAMVVGPLAARLTGACAILLYSLLSACLSLSWLRAPPDQAADTYHLPIGELLYAGLLNVLGLLLVTLLAGNLSARVLRAGGRLRLAEANAATLARLNDDIVRSLAAGVLTSDLEGRVRTINPTGAEMLGVSPEDLSGLPVSDVLNVCLPAGGEVEEQSVVRAEASARRSDGTTFPVGYSMNPLINVGGRAIGTLVLFQDLSEITRLRRVAQRQERLAVLGRLSAGLAHEIRNPLSSISGSVQLVRESPTLTADERRLLSIVLTEVERLDDLVSTMLQVGRPREPQRRRQDLRELVASVVEVAQRGAPGAAEITIESRIPGEPVMANVDGDLVRQVIWNLVKNALQASPAGTVVQVSAALSGDQAVLEVSDEGEGLDTSQMEKVYNMFYSERTHGAGIGLALVRQIVDAHQGTIDIQSERSRGATFIVRFPG